MFPLNFFFFYERIWAVGHLYRIWITEQTCSKIIPMWRGWTPALAQYFCGERARAEIPWQDKAISIRHAWCFNSLTKQVILLWNIWVRRGLTRWPLNYSHFSIYVCNLSNTLKVVDVWNVPWEGLHLSAQNWRYSTWTVPCDCQAPKWRQVFGLWLSCYLASLHPK